MRHRWLGLVVVAVLAATGCAAGAGAVSGPACPPPRAGEVARVAHPALLRGHRACIVQTGSIPDLTTRLYVDGEAAGSMTSDRCSWGLAGHVTSVMGTEAPDGDALVFGSVPDAASSVRAVDVEGDPVVARAIEFPGPDDFFVAGLDHELRGARFRSDAGPAAPPGPPPTGCD
jgi:hypothetical protein